MKIPIAAILFLALTQIPAPAQSDKSELPRPVAPWIASVPERGAWQVVTVPPAAAPTDPAQPTPAPRRKEVVRIDATNWNAVKKDIFSYSDSSTATVLYFAGMALVEGQSSRGKPTPVLVHQLPGTDFSTLRSQGWFALDWLDGKYFQKTVPFTRKATPAPPEPELCFQYAKPEQNFGDSGVTIPPLTAWIRVADLQPVAIKIGSKTFEFQRLPDPSEPPPMTAEQAAKLLDLKDQNARMEKLAERNKRIQERREQKRKQNAAKETAPAS